MLAYVAYAALSGACVQQDLTVEVVVKIIERLVANDLEHHGNDDCVER